MQPNLNMNNYSNMPVSVPVNNNSGSGGYDPGLMQPSPQLSHSSLSPRPGSSSGMLDMNSGVSANGYPGSTSPLPPGGAPSPGLISRPHGSKQQGGGGQQPVNGAGVNHNMQQHSPNRPHLRVSL